MGNKGLEDHVELRGGEAMRKVQSVGSSMGQRKGLPHQGNRMEKEAVERGISRLREAEENHRL